MHCRVPRKRSRRLTWREIHADIDLLSIEAVPEGMKVLGLVRGSTARSRNIGRDITAALKNLVGGEVALLHQADG